MDVHEHVSGEENGLGKKITPEGVYFARAVCGKVSVKSAALCFKALFRLSLRLFFFLSFQRIFFTLSLKAKKERARKPRFVPAPSLEK